MDQNRPGKVKKIIFFIFLVAILILVSALYLYIGPEEFVAGIGIRNGYIVAFISSFFAGFSAFTTVPFYSLLVTFISGGMNPYLLCLITGTSLALGDIFLFYLGRKGRDMISGRVDRAINRMADFFRERNLERYIPVLSYIYMSFIPLPNDWLLLFLATLKYPQKNIYPIIILGDFTHAIAITYLTMRGMVIFS